MEVADSPIQRSNFFPTCDRRHCFEDVRLQARRQRAYGAIDEGGVDQAAAMPAAELGRARQNWEATADSRPHAVNPSNRPVLSPNFSAGAPMRSSISRKRFVSGVSRG